MMREMEVDGFLPCKDYESALTELSENEKNFGDTNRLLYLLNEGALAHYAGEYEASNASFAEAEALIEELYTKSLSRETACAITSDNLCPYDGEDYERVLVNVFMALNYLKLGMLDDAAVEARRIDLKLHLYTQEYEGENKYRNDAFARYLGGIIYEKAGEPNDAYISYRHAYDAYLDYDAMFGFEVPDGLKTDILRLAGGLGFDDHLAEYEEEFGIKYDGGAGRGTGEAVLVIMTGLGPFKREAEASLSFPDDDGKLHTFSVQVPELIERPSLIEGVAVSSLGESGRLHFDPFLAQDVDRIAFKNMDDGRAKTHLKAWLRAFAKFGATEKVKDKADTGNVLGNIIVGSIIDAGAREITRADIRCWRTIPKRIYICRMRLDPGLYDIEVDYIDGGGNSIGTSVIEGIEIVEGAIEIHYFNEFN